MSALSNEGDLVLERRSQANKTVSIGPVSISPPVTEDYWSYRVVLSDRQAVVGFPKYLTVGIGFAIEEDWNTNLPYRTMSAETIFNHIKHNKADHRIPDALVVKAIQMIREAAAEDLGTELEEGVLPL